MKLKKLLLSAAVMVCISICLCTSVLAVDPEDSRFKDKTWEQIMEQFLADHNVEADQITAGFYNTVTEEEHYWNKDTLMYGASIAKLPTNMLYAERISNGEMELKTQIRGIPYQNLQYLSLVNSDNPAMDTMVKDLGGGNYANFRKAILPYIGVSEEEATSEFLARNFFTPEQILYCLKLLYGNDEKYPGVEYCMTLASPYDYFKQNQPPYVIAHKYGWYTDNGTTYLNDSAIVYTPDPILIVMFTANVENNRAVLADYCSLMCDYAEYSRLTRYIDECYERTDLTLELHPEFISVSSPETVPTEYFPWQIYVVGAGCALLVIALLVLTRKKLLGLLLILLALAVIVAGGGPTELAVLAIREHTAEQVVSDFEEAFRTDSRGIAYLTHCDSAMAHSDGTDMQIIVTNKVAESFDLSIGKAVRSANHIAVPVTVTKVDLEALQTDLQSAWEPHLTALLKETALNDLYNEDGTYNLTLLEQAHQAGFEELMDRWEEYLYTEDTTLHLELNYTKSLTAQSPVWEIITDKNFLSMVNY